MLRSCTFEVRIKQKWISAAEFTPLNLEFGYRGGSTLGYGPDFAAKFFEQSPAALSCGYPVNFELHASYPQQDAWQEQRGWPAFLLDLIPQGFGRAALAEKLDLPPGSDASDWELLLAGAGNPVGNIRIQEAVRSPAPLAPRGFTLDEIVTREDSFVEYARQENILMSGSSGIQGDAPKMMLVMDGKNNWHADGTLPENQIKAHYIIKMRRGKTARDLMVIQNEAAYMRVALAMGLRGNPNVELHGSTLFIPRFDRRGSEYLGQESLFSLCGINTYGRSTPLLTFCKALHRYCTNADEDVIEFVLRDILNYVLGNTDNHGRNSAVLRYPEGRVALAPLFDFAPMYLDPEGVARRFRWDCEDKGGLDWHEVALECESIKGFPAANLRRGMGELARKMPALPEIMERAGVDRDIIERRTPKIEEQYKNLTEVVV